MKTRTKPDSTAEINMNRRSLSYNWTGEDRLSCAKERCGMAGCVALLVFGLIVLTKQSSVAPNDARDRQTWSAGLQDDRINPNPDVSWKAR
jgi:hypothetical protein